MRLSLVPPTGRVVDAREFLQRASKSSRVPGGGKDAQHAFEEGTGEEQPADPGGDSRRAKKGSSRLASFEQRRQRFPVRDRLLPVEEAFGVLGGSAQVESAKGRKVISRGVEAGELRGPMGVDGEFEGHGVGSVRLRRAVRRRARRRRIRGAAAVKRLEDVERERMQGGSVSRELEPVPGVAEDGVTEDVHRFGGRHARILA